MKRRRTRVAAGFVGFTTGNRGRESVPRWLKPNRGSFPVGLPGI